MGDFDDLDALGSWFLRPKATLASQGDSSKQKKTLSNKNQHLNQNLHLKVMLGLDRVLKWTLFLGIFEGQFVMNVSPLILLHKFCMTIIDII